LVIQIVIDKLKPVVLLRGRDARRSDGVTPGDGVTAIFCVGQLGLEGDGLGLVTVQAVQVFVGLRRPSDAERTGPRPVDQRSTLLNFFMRQRRGSQIS
jgi:hypothetical protein